MLIENRIAAAGRIKETGVEKRSVSSIVTAPANTGMIAINRNAVISHVQTNKGIFIRVIAGARMLKIVAMMLMAPMIDEIPSKCTEKIAKGNAAPVCRTSGG